MQMRIKEEVLMSVGRLAGDKQRVMMVVPPLLSHSLSPSLSVLLLLILSGVRAVNELVSEVSA